MRLPIVLLLIPLAETARLKEREDQWIARLYSALNGRAA